MRTAMMPLCLAAFLSLTALSAGAPGEKQQGSVASEVTTDPTGHDGARHSAESDWTTFTVPSNYVIIKDDTQVHELSKAGSEHRLSVVYDDYVEVVPGTGIKQPRTIRVQTWALGPKGYFAGRGWLKVKVDFTYVQFKP